MQLQEKMKELCKPMMLDCLSCEKRKYGKDVYGSHFCYDKECCTVPFAIVERGKVLFYIDK